VQGEPVNVPRLAPVPVRLPLPDPKFEGSIYEIQRGLKNVKFSVGVKTM
jgi:hypothetical protein